MDLITEQFCQKSIYGASHMAMFSVLEIEGDLNRVPPSWNVSSDEQMNKISSENGKGNEENKRA